MASTKKNQSKNTAKSVTSSAKKTTTKTSAPKKKTTKKAAPKKQVIEEPSIFRKKTIAERTVAFKTRNWAAVFGWIIIVLCALLALFLNFFMRGYSFSVLVCLCII